MKNKKVEIGYGKTMAMVMNVANPVKKKVIKTTCVIHKFINIKALELIKELGYSKEYMFFSKYIGELNYGAFWIDQDFRSRNHLYYLDYEKGMYGFSNALTEAEKYFEEALKENENERVGKSIFYLGTVCHLIQDMTVPHHVIRGKLKEHRGYEQFIRRKYKNNEFSKLKGRKIIKYKTVGDFIKENAENSYNIYYKVDQYDKHEKFDIMSNILLERAVETTAGALIKYYEIIFQK
ncbi:zinc dependent phospholipase C family protein [Clostridium bornimense]|uniref:zinc dependent phospholipase C family protein n=1 Tax=Clostridium bornimense TaxID=1216932 RepID=UPI001C0FA510|nr:zinc dependent phospholipase C family protein [uncultured Clostridium sp.]MBU5317497.1 zinc dependent phospholipase C family protein [Clostridium bornimense]